MKTKILALGFIFSLMATLSTKCMAEESLSDLCVEHFDAANNATIKNACDSIINNTAANCVLFLKQDRSNLINECAKLSDSRMGEECIRYHVNFEDLDSRVIASCNIWNNH